MSDVPPEVMVGILSRLPVKSLLRFRSVSKPWRALIDSAYFVNQHMNKSKITDKVLTLVRRSRSQNSFYSINLVPGLTFVKLEIPIDLAGYSPDYIVSCNGLICLSKGDPERHILLWNPSKRYYKLIEGPVLYPRGSGATFAIDRVGYDHQNDDHKVVRFAQVSKEDDEDSVESKVAVYSMKLDVWQSVEQNLPFFISYESCNGHGVCVDGFIHMVVTETNSDTNYLIAAFDLASQSFQMVPQPEYSVNYVSIDLEILGGCLSVVGNHEMFTVDVWVMGKYGVKESWSKLFTLAAFDGSMNFVPCVRPIMFMNDGKEVLLELGHTKFVRYDLENKKFTYMGFYGAIHLSTFVYHETLV